MLCRFRLDCAACKGNFSGAAGTIVASHLENVKNSSYLALSPAEENTPMSLRQSRNVVALVC